MAYFSNRHCDLTAEHGPYGVRAITLAPRIADRLETRPAPSPRRAAEHERRLERLWGLVEPSDRDCAA